MHSQVSTSGSGSNSSGSISSNNGGGVHAFASGDNVKSLAKSPIPANPALIGVSSSVGNIQITPTPTIPANTAAPSVAPSGGIRSALATAPSSQPSISAPPFNSDSDNLYSNIFTLHSSASSNGPRATSLNPQASVGAFSGPLSNIESDRKNSFAAPSHNPHNPSPPLPVSNYFSLWDSTSALGPTHTRTHSDSLSVSSLSSLPLEANFTSHFNFIDPQSRVPTDYSANSNILNSHIDRGVGSGVHFGDGAGVGISDFHPSESSQLSMSSLLNNHEDEIEFLTRSLLSGDSSSLIGGRSSCSLGPAASMAPEKNIEFMSSASVGVTGSQGDGNMGGTSRVMCRDWLSGSCGWGSRCRYQHSNDSSSIGNRGSSTQKISSESASPGYSLFSPLLSSIAANQPENSTLVRTQPQLHNQHNLYSQRHGGSQHGGSQLGDSSLHNPLASLNSGNRANQNLGGLDPIVVSILSDPYKIRDI